MDSNLLKTFQIDNGLKIDIIDESKKMVGDRWKISVVIKTDIPVANYTPDKKLLDVDPGALKKALGDTVLYEKKQERVFVADKEKDSVISSIINSFEKEILKYMSNAEFPKRFIFKKYNEALKTANLEALKLLHNNQL